MMVNTGYVKIVERLSKVEESNKNQSSKIDDIHKILVGNGRIGLVDEWNQWKGGIKFFGWVMGIVITAIGSIVGVLMLK